MEVVERFLLHGVYGQCTGVGIYLAHKYAAFVATAATFPCHAIAHSAMVRTELALNGTIVYLFIIFTLMLHHNLLSFCLS